MTQTNKFLIVVIAALAVMFGVAIGVSNTLSREYHRYQHNYQVMLDSVQTISTKYGELLFEKGSLVLEKKELEDALGVSNKQIKEYEKQLGSKLAYISKLESRLTVKDTITNTIVIRDTVTNSLSTHYEDKWMSFDQMISYINPTTIRSDIYNTSFNVPLKVGLTEDYTIFVTSPNPYFNITSIDGAVIDKRKFAEKPRRWTFSIYAGFGGQYGLINKRFDVGPQIGAGVGYRIF